MTSRGLGITALIVVTCLALRNAAAAAADQVVPGTKSQLIDHLFTGYNNDVIPTCDKKILVVIDMSLRSILDVDERKQIITANVWLRFRWNDCALSWNRSSQFSQYDQVIISSSRVWIPDIQLIDSVQGEMADFKNTRSIVKKNGDVLLYTPAVLRFTCKIDMTYFPFDRQNCKIKFASWSYTGSELNITNFSSTADTKVFSDNGEWNLIGLPVRYHTTIFPCCDDPFPDVTYYLLIERQHLYYTFNLAMPCLMITLIALLVFYLPPESGEKISLGITVLLSLCVFLLMVSEQMPATSETIPLIAQFFGATIALVSLSCMLTVVVIHVHHRTSFGHSLPRWAKFVFIDVFSKVFCIGDTTTSRTSPSLSSSSTSTTSVSFRGRSNSFMKAHREDSSEKLMSESREYSGLDSVQNTLTSSFSDNCEHGGAVSYNQIQMNHQERKKKGYDIQTTLDEQLDVLNHIKKHFDSEDDSSMKANEWRIVALVLDRLFFIVVSLTTLLTMVFMFLQKRVQIEEFNIDD